MKIKKEIFGNLLDGREASLFTLTHPNKSEIKITNYGATVVSIRVPDKDGSIEDVALGFDNIESYENIRYYYGTIVGRYGNRIANGKFSLDGNEYEIPINDGENTLHGGNKGFDRQLWAVEDFGVEKNAFVKLSYLSKDGEEGFPGNMKVIVTYSFTLDQELVIDYEITSDKMTVCNLTNHSYFNLSGNIKDDILNHELMINADKFTPVRKGSIPTGELKSVENSPLDFRKHEVIGKRINVDCEQVKLGGGYDHNWVLNDFDGTLKLACSAFEPNSGRVMETYTTEPAVQFYSGNFLDGSHVGLSEKVYQRRDAFCLETQHYPDSPNQEKFPTTVLNPDETYTSTTVYKFFVKNKKD